MHVAVMWRRVKEGRSLLNTFDVGVSRVASVHANDQKSFASFLQKRRPFFS
jgi:hypothetical protein